MGAPNAQSYNMQMIDLMAGLLTYSFKTGCNRGRITQWLKQADKDFAREKQQLQLLERNIITEHIITLSVAFEHLQEQFLIEQKILNNDNLITLLPNHADFLLETNTRQLADNQYSNWRALLLTPFATNCFLLSLDIQYQNTVLQTLKLSPQERRLLDEVLCNIPKSLQYKLKQTQASKF